MSRPGNSCLCCLNDSLIILFSRFRPVASRQFFLLTARPSRGSLVRFGRKRTVNIWSRLRSASLKTRLKASLSGSRLRRLNRLSVAGLLSVAYTDRSTNASGRQLRPSLRATALQHEAAGLRCHSRSESMRTSPLESAGLKCSFHLGATWLNSVCAHLLR